MKFSDIALMNKFNPADFEKFALKSGYQIKGLMANQIDDNDVPAIVRDYKRHLEEEAAAEAAKIAAEEEAARLEAEHNREIAAMLVTSGFSFEGYRIVKYSGYISGDDAIQVPRGLDSIFSSGTDVGAALMDSLVKIRRNALTELKEAAFDLGCNAVIGVDFDYLTLDPQTANLGGGTTYQPYVFGVTANGNAVVIEKIED